MKDLPIFLISILLFGCSDNEIKPAKEDISAIRQILDASFLNQKELLPKNSPEGINWEYIIESEKIFDAFWNPTNLKQYGDSKEISRFQYKQDKYLIVQTEYRIAIPDMPDCDWAMKHKELYDDYRHQNHVPGEFKTIEYSIHTNVNFASRVEIQGYKVLHLNSKLESELNSFLRTDVSGLGTPSRTGPRQFSVDAKRFSAVKTMLTVFPDHWGNRWRFISQPEVETILVNQRRDQALVFFQIGSVGGYTLMKKDNGNWRIVESDICWIA